MNNLHPLLEEYKDLVAEAASLCYSGCFCSMCNRMQAIEAEISTALECAPLIADVRAAVDAANAELETRKSNALTDTASEQISEAVAQRPTWAISENDHGK